MSESRVELMWQAVVAIVMTTFYFSWHPAILVDDAGFIIRYLRQADAGCWYCFNAVDGPLFGISSFSHGAVNLFLYRAGFGTPEECLWLSNVAGTFATAWLLLRILRRLLPAHPLSLPLAVATLFGAKSWMMIAATGMEVPLHTAVVLAALLALVDNRGRAVWFWSAIAVISKLDAVPIVVAFAALHLWQRRAVTAHALREAAVYGGIPLLCWIAFATWYFGSPLPHSASAKLLLHQSTLAHWFPFGERYLTGAWLRFELALFLVLWPLHVALRWRRERTILPDTAPGWAFTGLLILYFVFNPAERMEWYYALPDLFLMLQILLSLHFVGGVAGAGGLVRTAVPISMVVVAGLCVFDSAVGVRWFSGYLRSLEAERLAIGQHVADHTASGEVLLAGHGLPGAWSPAVVVDYSGLNSNVPLQYNGDWGVMARALRPDALVVGGYDYYLTPLQGLPYRIEDSFYEIADHGAPPWHFIRAVAPPESFSMSSVSEADLVFAAGGTHVEWVARERDFAPGALRLGVQRPPGTPADLEVRISWEGVVVEEWSITVPAAETRTARTRRWHSVVLPLDSRFSSRAGYRVALRFAQALPLRVSGPILTSH
jgi:hypothetical protein